MMEATELREKGPAGYATVKKNATRVRTDLSYQGPNPRWLAQGEEPSR